MLESFPASDISAESTKVTILWNKFKRFANYSKFIVAFREDSNVSEQYIFFRVTLPFGDSSSPATKPANIIVYGVKGEHSSVPPSVYKNRGLFDHSGEAHVKGNLNMNCYRIYNLTNPNNGNEAATKLYLDDHVKGARTMKGNIDMDSLHKIINLPIPTNPNDAGSPQKQTS